MLMFHSALLSQFGFRPTRKIRFTSSILPKWARRTKSLDALLPVLYLRGVSTGDFHEALSALLGKDAPNLSPAVISRLTAEWQTFINRPISNRQGCCTSSQNSGLLSEILSLLRRP